MEYTQNYYDVVLVATFTIAAVVYLFAKGEL